MRAQIIKFKDPEKSYSIILGNKVLGVLPEKIKRLCPRTRKIGIIFGNDIYYIFI